MMDEPINFGEGLSIEVIRANKGSYITWLVIIIIVIFIVYYLLNRRKK